MIDMHVHILPGVDDGAQGEQMTRQMMRRAKDAGIGYTCQQCLFGSNFIRPVFSPDAVGTGRRFFCKWLFFRFRIDST